MLSRSIPLTPSVTQIRIQSCLFLTTNWLAHWSFSPLPPFDIDNTESLDYDVPLPPTVTRQLGRLRTSRTEEREKQRKKQGTIQIQKCTSCCRNTEREHVLDHLSNKKASDFRIALEVKCDFILIFIDKGPVIFDNALKEDVWKSMSLFEINTLKCMELFRL